MKFILGEKLGMSQIFQEDGRVVPVTLIKAGQGVVLQVRTKEKDGYEAVQIGFGEKKGKNVNKAQKGHFKDMGSFRFVREFRDTGTAPAVGDKIDVSVFQPGDVLKIAGISKGKGFQGVVKRYGFKGGPKTHGQTHRLRAPGSIGSTTPQHVIKGKRMSGRMGGDHVTVRNLKVVAVDAESGMIAVRGAVPGVRGGLLEIKSVK